MHRVFTHLTSGWRTVLSSMAESVFFKTRTFPLWSFCKATKQQQKFLAHTARGSRGISFFFFEIEIELFILLIKFNSTLTFLKDARERGAHEDCQSPLPGQVGPGLTV